MGPVDAGDCAVDADVKLYVTVVSSAVIADTIGVVESTVSSAASPAKNIIVIKSDIPFSTYLDSLQKWLQIFLT